MRQGLKAICWVSFLCCISTLMVATTLSVYQEQYLHFSKITVGRLQAYATLSMHLTPLFCGFLIDRFKNYKMLLAIGVLLSGIIKPFLGYTTTISGNVFIRMLERFAKGFRATPTDAYISAIQTQETAGFGFAWKQIAWGVGAVVGCLISSLFLGFFGPNFKMLYVLAGIPCLLAVVVVVFAITMPKDMSVKSERFSRQALGQFSHTLWGIYALVFFVNIARFGENYIGHRFNELGVPFHILPLFYILYDFPVAAISGWMRTVYDAKPWLTIIIGGMVLLLFANTSFFFCESTMGLVMGTIAFGLHIAVTNGLFYTLIARHTPGEIRGTAYGLYHLVMGLGLFISHHTIGYMGHHFNSWCAGFGFNALFSLIILSVCLVLKFCRLGKALVQQQNPS